MVRFYKKAHEPPGRDSIKIMEVTRPKLPRTTYPFATWHAGYSQIELHADESQRIVWMVDPSPREPAVGCSLDLMSGKFTDERGDHPKSVGATSGQIIPASVGPSPSAG